MSFPRVEVVSPLGDEAAQVIKKLVKAHSPTMCKVRGGLKRDRAGSQWNGRPFGDKTETTALHG